MMRTKRWWWQCKERDDDQDTMMKFERENGDLDSFLLEKYNMQDTLVIDLLLEDSEDTNICN